MKVQLALESVETTGGATISAELPPPPQAITTAQVKSDVDSQRTVSRLVRRGKRGSTGLELIVIFIAPMYPLPHHVK